MLCISIHAVIRFLLRKKKCSSRYVSTRAAFLFIHVMKIVKFPSIVCIVHGSDVIRLISMKNLGKSNGMIMISIDFVFITHTEFILAL